MKRSVIFLILASIFFVKFAFAALSLEVTQGMSAALPIALIPFNNNSLANVPGNTTVTAMVHNDLQNSGQFKVIEPGLFDASPDKVSQVDLKHWQQRGVNNLVLGSIKPLPNGSYQVSFSLLNVYSPKNPVILSQTFTTVEAGLRNLSHHISNLIFEKLTGIRGIFATKIAYVLVEGNPGEKPKYTLVVADEDGFDPQTLLVSSQPIMSPTWTPNGKQLAYVSFENHAASIYLQNLSTGGRRLVSHFPGINGAPSFSPDGNRLAMVLSTTGNPKVFMFNMQTHKLSQITHGYSIDTEPSWAPDGKSILFTSNRGGTPQIYRYYFAGNRTERITFDGNYNARGSFLPNGQGIVMMHRESDSFGIAKQNLENGFVQDLTVSGSDESPSVAPNGKMVIYAKQFSGRGVLAAVSTDGRIKLRLPSREGNVQEPAWSPFLHT
jgi:TolB protein